MLGTSSTESQHLSHVLPQGDLASLEPLCVSGDILIDPSFPHLDPSSTFDPSSLACTYDPLALDPASYNPFEVLPPLDPLLPDFSFLATPPEPLPGSSDAPISLDPPAVPTFSPADLSCFFPAPSSLAPPTPIDWHLGDLAVAPSTSSSSPPSLVSPNSTTSTSSHLSPSSAPPSLTATPASSTSSRPLASTTSTRASTAAPVDLEAPIRPQGVCLLPSVTARKALTAKGAKLLAKKQHHGASASPSSSSPSSSKVTASASVTAPKEPAIPPDVAAAMERKRVQNTLSARRCRAKKQARVAELEEENEALRRRVDELEELCRQRGLAL
ncbi:hypothetical protein JCM3775_007570 [Rhodotorula graminis]